MAPFGADRPQSQPRQFATGSQKRGETWFLPGGSSLTLLGGWELVSWGALCSHAWRFGRQDQEGAGVWVIHPTAPRPSW